MGLNEIIVLENENIRLELLSFGARILRCLYKVNNTDVVLGYDSSEGFKSGVRYMNATVGRVCNRIGNGEFKLNDKVYSLLLNNHGNTLHGGPKGFDERYFDYKVEEDKVIFELVSLDNDEGFPGKLELSVTYRLLKDGFTFEYSATSDKDTLCSITNHAYFNLNDNTSNNALNHKVKINANRFAHVDKNGLTLPVIQEVKDTPFDFTDYKVVGDAINLSSEQLQNGTGFDHNYILEGTGLKDCVSVIGDSVIMDIKTTLPCVHFYSGNFLDGTSTGKGNIKYIKNSGLCFETQYYPNSINYHLDNIDKPILRSGEKMSHITEFIFKGV